MLYLLYLKTTEYLVKNTILCIGLCNKFYYLYGGGANILKIIFMLDEFSYPLQNYFLD